MVIKPTGSLTSLKLAQSLKVWGGIIRIAQRKSADCSVMQHVNAACPMCVIESGSLMVVSASHSLKLEEPMEEREGGKLMARREMQLLKAWSPISVQPSGSTIPLSL